MKLNAQIVMSKFCERRNVSFVSANSLFAETHGVRPPHQLGLRQSRRASLGAKACGLL